jgi:hypothetical protein
MGLTVGSFPPSEVFSNPKKAAPKRSDDLLEGNQDGAQEFQEDLILRQVRLSG